MGGLPASELSQKLVTTILPLELTHPHQCLRHFWRLFRRLGTDVSEEANRFSSQLLAASNVATDTVVYLLFQDFTHRRRNLQTDTQTALLVDVLLRALFDCWA